MDIGISLEDRTEISRGLGRLLANSYQLYLTTHQFHWNVTGPMFQTLHLMFETQYTEMATAIDQIAERIRALGFFAPGSFSQYSELSSIEEVTGVPAATEMVAILTRAHETSARVIREIFPSAEKARDQATMDLLTQRLNLHEKTAWMLRSLIEASPSQNAFAS